MNQKIPFELTPKLILDAYSEGLFPMADSNGNISWFIAEPRCVFDLEYFHIPKRLKRIYKSGLFELKVDTVFAEVIEGCADRPTTWISNEISEAYKQLHVQGWAHSIEAFQGGKLAGGLYGVALGGAFMAESMFHIVSNASKVCLVYLVERLNERGYVLLDSQYMMPETAYLSHFGAFNISHQEYLAKLKQALKLRCCFD